MKHAKAQRGAIFGLLVGVVALLVTTGQQAQNSVSFDILFPQNWYNRALHSCMKVWTDLDTVLSDQDVPFEQRQMMVDAAIGKISYCANCFETRVNHSYVGDDDVEYLVRILYSLDGKCDQLAGRQFDDKLSCLQSRIKQLKIQLLELLQTDGATLSSRD